MKIIFTKVRYKNFLSTGNDFIEIDLNSYPTTLICGGNGKGKSSFMDAICFALYGKPFRKVNKPQLVNSIIGKNLLTEIEFILGTKTFLVRRGIKPNIFEIYVNGEMVNQNAEMKDYQEVLEKNILRMNYKTFCQIVILGSANFVPFMQLPSQSKREFIEDLLDIQIFSSMNILLKEKIAANKELLTDCDNKLSVVQTQIQMTKNHIADLKESTMKLVGEKQNKIQSLLEENTSIESSVISIREQVEQLEKKIEKKDSIQTNLTKLNTIISQFNRKITKINSEIEFYKLNDQCPTCSQSIDVIFKTAKIDEKNTHINEITETISSSSEKLKKLEEALSTIENITRKITNLNRTLFDENSKMTTNLRLIDSFNREIKELNTQIIKTDTNNDLKKYKRELKELEKEKMMYVEQRELYASAALLLKDTGIKARVVKQYVPILNKLINKYLEQMEFFCLFEMDESFNEKIKSRHRDEFSYESFSEGEKMRLDLSMLFAWREITRLRNSSACNLLIFDEVIDSSLDANGTEEFLKIVKDLAKDNNIIIISHKNDQISDKFDNVIVFDKVKNFSKIQEAR